MTTPVRVHLPITGADAVVIDTDQITDTSVPKDVLAVYVVNGGTRAGHPVQGRYTLRAPSVQFMPYFGFNAGQEYQIEIAGHPPRTFTLAHQTPAPAPHVTDIFPTAPRIPRNTLRLYVAFTAPMQRQRAHDFLRLLDNMGHDVTEIIVDLGQELWSPDSTRLTLLLDPGRAKRAIHAKPEPGLELTEGRTYTLVVEPGWPGTTGAALTMVHRRSFEIGPAQRAPLDPRTWTLSAPPPSTRDPLLLDFPTTMDIATLSNRIEIFGPDGRTVAGAVAIGPGEQRWSFTPARLWATAPHRLVIDIDLEDIAGNRVGDALDHEAHERPQEKHYGRCF